MNSFLSRLRDTLTKTIDLWIKQRVTGVLSNTFNVYTSGSVNESQLKQILQYRFKEQTPSFFIMGWSTQDTKERFHTEHIDQCEGSEWFAMIRPNDSSHIIFPKLKIWFIYDWRSKVFEPRKTDWKEWWKWWWSFQLDKNIGKYILHSPLSGDDALSVFNKQYKK